MCIRYHVHFTVLLYHMYMISYAHIIWNVCMIFYILTNDIICTWYHINHAWHHVNDIIYNFGISFSVTRYQVFPPQGRPSQTRTSYDGYGGSYDALRSGQMTPNVRVRWWNICAARDSSTRTQVTWIRARHSSPSCSVQHRRRRLRKSCQADHVRR